MIAGPYSSGKTEESKRENLERLNKAAVQIFEMGFVPIIGVNNALPLIHAAGRSTAIDEIMMPLSLALVSRCDACLRLSGDSRGADTEVSLFQKSLKPVFYSLEEIRQAVCDRFWIAQTNNN